MKTIIHALGGLFAFILIAGFLISTLAAELFLSYEAIVLVKRSILYAMFMLIPIFIITGGSGFSLAKQRSS